MNKKFLKAAAISATGIVGGLYVLFLAAPFFVNGFLNSHSAEIVKALEEASGGYKIELSEMKVLTTPKLTAGFKLGNAKVTLPNRHELLSADNFEIKMSLLPILLRRIELDKISVENVKITLEVLNGGRFMIEDFIPKSEPKEGEPVQAQGLPFGLKLSNRLPNIYMQNYDIEFIDVSNSKKYTLDGGKFNITDFIVNKKFKLNADGKMVFDGEKQFTYDIKFKNYIMPDVDLNDLVFAQTPAEEPSLDENGVVGKCGVQNSMLPFDVIEIFEAIHKNQLKANLNADVKTYGTLEDINYDGKILLDGMSVALDGKSLPESSMNLELKGKETKVISVFYTSNDKNESTVITGDIKTGKNLKYGLHFISNAKFNNIINLLDSLAKSFGIYDLETLSATGNLDANFWIIGDAKKVKSSGYFKIPSATLKYTLYNILIDKINAEVSFEDNNVDVKNVSFSILNQPLVLNGTISSEAVSDLHLKADKLPLKGLVAAAGQVALLKENNFNSGTLSMDASLKGKLSNPKPAINLSIDNVNIKNIPSSTTLSLESSKVDITTDGKTFKGIVNAANANIINPMAKIKAPEAKITIGEKDINIDNAYILLNNSRINIAGKITDFMAKNLSMDITAKGNLISSDLKNMLPADFKPFVGGTKGTLPLNIRITGNAKEQDIAFNLTANSENYFSIFDIDLLKGKNTTIKSKIKFANDTLKFSDSGIFAGTNPVVMFDGTISGLSKTQKLALNVSIPKMMSMPIPGMGSSSIVKVKGDITAGGTALNPTLKGNVSVPSLKIPAMLLAMDDMNITLNGALANGKAVLKKVASGGIVAENLSSDFTFNPKTNVFTLKNISGTAFSGKINGNVSYNVMSGKIGVDMSGVGLNAITAIEGAAGIKNALSGTLGFDVRVTTSGATDVDMIKNLKGDMSFKIADGAFGSIGRIENLIAANNVMANVIMKAAVATISTIPVIKNSANFKYIKGVMSFNNGWANITSIKSSGSSIAYYITGKYNILNGSANLIILGRLGSDVVAVLGPVGELSVNKLTSYLPRFGAATASIINTMTSDPKNEKTSEIPQLSSGNEVYKDFKVTINGGIESKSSVKSFKWLSNPDMSAIEAPSLKEQIETSREQIKTNIENKIDAAKTIREQSRQDFKEQVQNVKDSVDEIKNLFKSKNK